MGTIDFGMPTLIENKNLQANVDLCKRLGLKFIELNMNFPEYQIDKLGRIDSFIKPAMAAEIYYTIHLDETLNVADFNPLVRDAYFETVKRTIAVAKKFFLLKEKFAGNKNPVTINMHMCHGIYITLPDRKVLMYERDFKEYMGNFHRFRDCVERWIGTDDVKILIENTDGFRDYEKKAIDMLLESPCFGLTWDIGHSKAVGEKDVDFIMERSKKLCHMHIHDGTENPARNHLALGDGEIDIAGRLRVAKETGSRCVLETKTIEALKKSVAEVEKQDI